MKRKFVAIVLCITVALTMMPAMAFAAAQPQAVDPNKISTITIAGQELKDNDLDGNPHPMSDKIPGAEGTYTVKGNTLILNKVKAGHVVEDGKTNTEKSILEYSSLGANKDLPLTIKLEGDNVLTQRVQSNQGKECISVSGHLNIEGPGSLTVIQKYEKKTTGQWMDDRSVAPIALQGSLHIKSGTVVVKAENQVSGWGIKLAYEPSSTLSPKVSKLQVDPGAVVKATGSNGGIMVVDKQSPSNERITLPEAGRWQATPEEQAKKLDSSTYWNFKFDSGENGYYENDRLYAVYNKDGTIAKTVEIGGTPKPAASAEKVSKPAAPKSIKAKATGTSKIKVSWKKVEGARQYYVYKAAKKNDKYKLVKKVKGSTLTVKKLKTDTKYYFKVRAKNSAGYSKYSKKVSARTKGWFSLQQKGKSKIKVKWQPQKGAKGYQIANNDGGKMKVRWTGNVGNCTYTSVRKDRGKIYKFKMRYYKTKKGKRVYSKWTSVQNIKMK